MANDIDKTSPHYKGEFGSIYEVNQKFPSGGVEGDYVAIDGWAHYWNADRGTWCVNAQRDSYWDELITGIIEKFKLFKGATYMGVAGLDTVPAKAIGAKMYYFATVAGTYKNFGELVVPQGINVLYSENGSSWVCSTLLEVAQELGVSTRMVVSQKVVNDALNLKANHSSVNEALGKKFDKESVVQESGDSDELVMSQKAVSAKLSDISDKQGKLPLSKNSEVNEQIIELYLTGASHFKLANTYIHNERYALNITDSENNIVAYYDELVSKVSIADMNMKVLEVYEKNNSGVHGYIVIDANKITSFNYHIELNEDRITCLNCNPIIKHFLELKDLSNIISQEKNEEKILQGKTYSILGDSISTYEGYVPYQNEGNENKVYYPKGDVDSVEKTWWKMLENKTGLTLIKNQSLGSSDVSTSNDAYRASFVTRCTDLGDKPDYIFIYGGTNDIYHNREIGINHFFSTIEDLDTTKFADAYDKMLRLIKENYTDSKIICIIPAHASSAMRDIICSCAKFHKIFLTVDLKNIRLEDFGEITLYHPNYTGMKQTKDCIINSFVSLANPLPLNNEREIKRMNICTDNNDINDIIEVINIKSFVADSVYTIHNIMNYEGKYVFEIYKDGEVYATMPRTESPEKIVHFGDVTAIVYWKNVGTTLTQGTLNNKKINSVLIEVIQENTDDVSKNSSRIEKLSKINISSYPELTDLVSELYLANTSDGESYGLENIYVQDGRIAVNIKRLSDGNLVATYDSLTSQIPSDSIVLPLSPREGYNENGYIVCDVSKTISFHDKEYCFNTNVITNIKNSPLIQKYVEELKSRISDNHILRNTVKELYLVGASSDETYGVANFFIQGDRHVINVGRKSDGKIIASADVSSDWDGILELKEKNNSGVSGFAVVDWNNYTTKQKVYPFNNSYILSLANNPSIDSYIKSLKTTEESMNSVKRITERITAVDKQKLVHWEPKDSSKSNIDALKLGNFVDANEEGFLPSSDATTNVTTMNRLLASGGTIIVSQPGEYEVNGRMVLNSNTTLVFAEGVIIKLVSDCPYVLINAAAFKNDGSYDENIKVIGYHLNTNGFNNSCGINGLRGYLTFFHVKHVYVSDVRCMWYKAHIFFIHCCDWEDVEFANCFVIGDKDAFHFGRGFNGYLHDLTICAVDDSIALNAWDFADSNPQIGDIHDVLIENIVELPHYYNVNSEYSRTLGYTTRFLNGSWLPWTSGMEVQHSTTVTYKNNIYRVINLFQKTAISTATPSEGVGTDGIQWRKEASGDNLGCCCYNIELRNIVSYQTKNEGNFGFNAINEVDHKSWVEGATPHPNHDIHFSNIQVYDNNSTIFNIQGDVDNVYVDNSILDITTLVNGMIYMNPRFENENFTKIPTFSFYDSLYIIGDSGVVVKSNSSNRDTIILNYRGVRLSSDKSKLIYTENTTVNTIKDYDFPKCIGTHANIGDCKFSLTLNKPIWWNGKSWVNSVGEVVHKVEL